MAELGRLRQTVSSFSFMLRGLWSRSAFRLRELIASNNF
jgi:hypothetical protein